ncbi:E3 ubiquitin ligase PQT3-like [Tasmannia lanceolata]|uniref:E3 ubiquitin ligase PQT3-like n=1 Tax=Tasmannia lanceolata TaxID=3420 RepID=UPI00406414B2
MFRPYFQIALLKIITADVLTSKCCFKSFCDKCIRDHIISKPSCVCGATNILADDLLPNKTLRETISRFLESTTSSAERAGSFSQVQDMESALCPQPKAPSPTLSATAKEAHLSPSHKDDTPNLKQTSNEAKVVNAPQQSGENITTKNVNLSEAMRESMSFKEPKSQGSAPLADEEVQQSVPISEPDCSEERGLARVIDFVSSLNGINGSDASRWSLHGQGKGGQDSTRSVDRYIVAAVTYRVIGNYLDCSVHRFLIFTRWRW